MNENNHVNHESVAQDDPDLLQSIELGVKSVEIPGAAHVVQARAVTPQQLSDSGLMEDGSLDSLTRSIKHTTEHVHRHEIHVQYRNLTFWNMVSEKKIATVGSVVLGLFGVGGKTHRVNIINDLTGRILPKRMTLVMGPPGCG